MLLFVDFTCLTNLVFFVFFGCVCFLCVSCFVVKVNVNICGRITSEMFSFFTFFFATSRFLNFQADFLQLLFKLKIVADCLFNSVIDFVQVV